MLVGEGVGGRIVHKEEGVGAQTVLEKEGVKIVHEGEEVEE